MPLIYDISEFEGPEISVYGGLVDWVQLELVLVIYTQKCKWAVEALVS